MFKSRTSYRISLSIFGKKQKKLRKLYRKKLYILKVLKQKSKSFLTRKIFKFSKYITIWNFDIQKYFDDINH